MIKRLPISVYVLVAYCALYTGLWGAWMLFQPEGYYAFANMTPEHFPPSSEFWGWFGISGGLFYGLFLFFHRKLPYMALASAIVSFAGVSVTFYMLVAGPLTGKMASIHLSGDIAGTIGFGIAAWLEYAVKRDLKVSERYFSSGTLVEGLTTEFKTQKGITLKDLSEKKEVMLVFLRHFGCTFCREALDDLSRERDRVEEAGKEIVLVHMVDDATAKKHVAHYGLINVHRISDPEQKLYKAFDLQRASYRQVFGLPNWIEGFRAGILKGYLVGMQTGDGFQMPGVFILYQGKVKHGFRHQNAADRPDYCRLAECAT